jgi:hypothetical protein
MSPKKILLLQFNSQSDLPDKKLRDGLSAVVQIGSSLWLANDEMLSVERLAYQGQSATGEFIFADHCRFSLNDLLNLPAPPKSPQKFEEADIEGLAYDETEGYLWLIGSHSLKRKQPEKEKSSTQNIERLRTVTSDGNRYLLARIPVVEQNGNFNLLRKDLDRTAAQLQGQPSFDALTKALADDEHLKDFFTIPSKDNGFDIEGLAVAGKRLFIGLRGPVLRGWAIILEVEPRVDEGDRHSLNLHKIGDAGRLYFKHFIQLGGLGVRDLCVQGDDLLILAGPTLDLDGPVTVHRWANGVHTAGDSVVFKQDLEKVMDIPFGQGEDHAEGMTLFSVPQLPGPSLLVVYDAPGGLRKVDEGDVLADIYEL